MTVVNGITVVVDCLRRAMWIPPSPKFMQVTLLTKTEPIIRRAGVTCTQGLTVESSLAYFPIL